MAGSGGTVEHEVARDALAERVVGAAIAALDLLHVYLGEKLGLYHTLAAEGPLSAAELADRAGIAERYAREWLEQQAVAGILATEEPADGEPRRFELPPGHAEALTDGDSLAFVAPLALGVTSLAGTLPLVLEAFRSGGGVPYEAYGPDIRWSIARLNRPMFLNLLGSEWFPAVPGLADRLGADPPARVADIGCGSGWSSIAIARAFPKVTVVGLDLDEASVAEARANAAAEGLDERVSFEVRDAADPGLAGGFDLVLAFETIHDMNDPVGALRAMRALRAPGGTVLVADERVADAFTVDVEPGERFQWGWSALHCLPCAMTAPPAMGTGTIMRRPTLEAYAREAGFSGLEVLPIENDFWRFYRLEG
ncbi:MAG TPA: class I SAM-dependent methyltransferase [Actinomycetota bacterium]|nr:class I SAM-dependent methyltransferase [Actinomycetota bacterium]